MSQTWLIEDFIQNEVLQPDLQLHKPRSFRTHVQLLLDEASRRGWSVKENSRGLYSIYDQQNLVGVLQQMITSLTSSTAVSICSRKHTSRTFFEQRSVPIAKGASFLESESLEAIRYFETSQKPLVVKPSRGAGGKGISTNVDTLGSFERAWREALDSQGPKSTVVVEEQVSGVDIRVFVVGGQIAAASTRLPAFVVGDGVTTLSTLIEEKQAERSESAYLRRMPIVVDDQWIAKQGFTQDTIPESGNVVILNLAFNIHQGGTNLDLTDRLSIPLRELALKAAAAVPGLEIAGIDLMVKSLNSAEGAIVLEANTAANIAVHHYPGYGNSQPVAPRILDLLETRFNQQET